MLKGKKARTTPVFWFLVAIGILYFIEPDFKNSINNLVSPGANKIDKDNAIPVTFSVAETEKLNTPEFNEPSGGEMVEYGCQIIKVQVVYDKIFSLSIGNPSFSEPSPYEGIVVTLIPYSSRLYVEYEDRDGLYQEKQIGIGCFKDIGVYYFDPTRDPPIFMKDSIENWELPPYKSLGIEFSSDKYSSSFQLDSGTIDLAGIDSTNKITSTTNIDNTSALFNTNFLSLGTPKYDEIIDTTSPVIGEEVTLFFEYQVGDGSGGGGSFQD